MKVVWPLTNSPKSHATNLDFWLQIDMNWIFQMRYYTLLNVLLLQSYGPSKLAVKSISRRFGSEATFFVSSCSELLLSGQSRLESLRAHRLATLLSSKTLSTSIKRFKSYLWTCGNFEAYYASSKNPCKSYHNWSIEKEWQWLTLGGHCLSYVNRRSANF